MLVVDFMHEFELGVWKALFIHLVRILHAVAPRARQVAELDERFCYLVSTELFDILIFLQIPSNLEFWVYHTWLVYEKVSRA
jgi:hypothetical protein